jgi:hypothetical protein
MHRFSDLIKWARGAFKIAEDQISIRKQKVDFTKNLEAPPLNVEV